MSKNKNKCESENSEMAMEMTAIMTARAKKTHAVMSERQTTQNFSHYFNSQIMK